MVPIPSTLTLESVTRERARVLAPALALGFTFFVTMAEPLGIAAPRAYHYAAVAFVVVSWVLAGLHWFRRIPERQIHVWSIAVLWSPLLATALALYGGRNPVYALLFISQIASAGVLLEPRLVAGTLVVANVVAVSLMVHIGMPYLATYISELVMATSFAWLIHVLMRRALVRSTQLHEQLLHAQRMDAVGTLASGLAHDMNNVLASITTFAELLQEERDGSEVQQIVAQAARGAALTRGLLTFSRRGQYRRDIIQLDPVIRDIVPLLQRTLPKTIDIRVRAAVEDVWVNADPQHLGQALVNLSLNASDAMAGKGLLEIEVVRADESVMIRVRDNGCGMSAETKLRAFEPFFTTKPMGKGTGLGLSTVWGIVEAHGGKIGVETSAGSGTVFTITLPTAERRAAAAPVAPPADVKIERARVLVVDDEPAVRMATQRLLERMGIEAIAATDGQDALRQFDPTIDLVVLDMGMPVMDGAQCFRAIREIRHVPVLIATGYADDAQAQELARAGAEIIEKPYGAADFRRALAVLLPQRKLAA